MKTRLFVVSVAALAMGLGMFALSSARAEMGNSRSHSGMMTGSMRGMMGDHAAERPLITLAIENKEVLGLTSDQVRGLESLRSEFQKEAIRRSADLEVAETELAELLRADSVDLAKVGVKLRQVEGLRTDLRLARIKTLEKGKALLTPEQRKKLDSIGPRASADGHGGMMGGRGMEEMRRFMNSERMPQAMTAMMEMARRMGDGDTMAGMVRMMEMMSMMGQMGGMMGPAEPQPSK
jgi:Spy/CpxP family protein refolding chaperone